MDKDDVFMSVNLGLEDSPTLTYGEVFARSVEVLALVQMGRPELGWLVAPGIFARCGRTVVNGFIVLLVPKPPVPEPEMTPHPGRGRQRRLFGQIERDDGQLEPVVAQTLALIRRNAELNERAAKEMNTAPDVGAALSDIEAKEGVKLEAAMRYHRGRRRETVVELAGQTVTFRALTVRVGFAGDVEPERRLVLRRPKGNHTDFRAYLEGDGVGLFGDGFNAGKTKPKLEDLRIGRADGWKRIVLEGARQLSLPVSISGKPVRSTKSLQHRRIEIDEVLNWDSLLDEVIAALMKERAARRQQGAA